MASQHLFFCCVTNCTAAAHVYGGRCDQHFELLITNLREAHNPSKSRQAEWLKEHDCKGFHYNEEVQAYTCSECRPCYPQLQELQELQQIREHILIKIRNTETMLSWGYDHERENLEQSLVQLHEKLANVMTLF